MRGHSLIELLIVLTLLGVTASALAPTARRYREWAGVVGAREALVGLLSEARSGALELGAACVRIETAPARASLTLADSVVRTVDLVGDFGVRVALAQGAGLVELKYGPMGLGRFASQTLQVRRGDAAAALVVSTYGRVRRQ